jgi:GT2 family glycosyltransferase
MRKEDAQTFGPFDEKLLNFAVCEDADLCLRIKNTGGKIRALEAICADHIGGATYSKIENKKEIERHAQINQEKLMDKWGKSFNFY